jgi:hypothetical protein
MCEELAKASAASGRFPDPCWWPCVQWLNAETLQEEVQHPLDLEFDAHRPEFGVEFPMIPQPLVIHLGRE